MENQTSHSQSNQGENCDSSTTTVSTPLWSVTRSTVDCSPMNPNNPMINPNNPTITLMMAMMAMMAKHRRVEDTPFRVREGKLLEFVSKTVRPKPVQPQSQTIRGNAGRIKTFLASRLGGNL